MLFYWRLYGIRNEDVGRCPPWREVAADVTAALEGRVLVAHHASVEQRVLGERLPGRQPPLVLDTMRLAKALWPGMAGYGLDRLVAHTEITPPPLPPGQHRHHRAGYDALLTTELLLTLVEHAVEHERLDWDQRVEAARLPIRRGTDTSA